MSKQDEMMIDRAMRGEAVTFGHRVAVDSAKRASHVAYNVACTCGYEDSFSSMTEAEAAIISHKWS